MPENTFNWLHLTDFHCGQHQQDWLWPSFKERFFQDLTQQAQQHGGWDVVFFTGDLVNRGTPKEFQQLNQILEELWKHFDKNCGCNPQLLAVPGNHDLKRPTSIDNFPAVLINWSANPSLQDNFWHKKHGTTSVHNRLKTAFKPYLDWWDDLKIKPNNIQSGLLPGDFAATVKKEDISIGVLGLNTAFLQLTDGDYAGKLAVHPKQFHEACGGDGTQWLKQHHACFLLTHHPKSWFNQPAKDYFNAHIAVHGNFFLHLCGHLHEAKAETIQSAFTEARRTWQGRSLFGLEYYGQELQRHHGYSMGQLRFGQRDKAHFSIIPRANVERHDGTVDIDRDGNLRLEDSGKSTEEWINLHREFEVSSNHIEEEDILIPHFCFRNRNEELAQICGSGQKNEKLPALMYIDAPAGMGKTTMLEKIQEIYSQEKTGWQCLLLGGWPADIDEVRHYLFQALKGQLNELNGKKTAEIDWAIKAQLTQFSQGNALFLLFDDIEKLDTSAIRWLRGLMRDYHNAKKAILKENSDEVSTVFRVIFTGRYISAARYDQHAWQRFGYQAISLKPFTKDIICDFLEAEAEQNPTINQPKEVCLSCADFVAHYSAGHPKVIQNLAHCLSKKAFEMPQKTGRDVIKGVFERTAIPVIKDMLSSLDTQIKEDFKKLSVFRFFNQVTANDLQKQGEICSNPVYLLATIGFIASKNQHGYYSDSILRQLVLIQLLLEDKDKYQQLHQLAQASFLEKVKDTVSRQKAAFIPDVDMSLLAEFYALEVLYHSAELCALDKNPSKFQEYKQQIITILSELDEFNKEDVTYNIETLISQDKDIDVLMKKCREI